MKHIKLYLNVNTLVKTGGIYKISCSKTDKVYIGETIHLKIRISEHFTNLRKCKHPNTILQNIFNKYGEETFKVEVLEYLDTKDEVLLKTREQYFQQLHPTCISLDSNQVFYVERSDELKASQKQILDKARDQAIETCKVPITIYDIVDKQFYKFDSVKEATSLIESKHIQKNIDDNILIPYKARYVAFRTETFDESMLENILYTKSEIGIARGEYNLYNLKDFSRKTFGSKVQFSLHFSESKNDLLYDLFDNKIDHDLYSTKLPTSAEEFLNMNIELTPSKMKFYRYYPVGLAYYAFRDGINPYLISKILGCSSRTIKHILEVRSAQEWLEFFENSLARVKSV